MIPPDNLVPGLFCTVVQGPRLLNADTLAPANVRDKSYQGDVLEVLAVSHPFVVVRHCSGIALFGPGNITLDTREYELMPLAQKFVDAALGKVKT